MSDSASIGLIIMIILFAIASLTLYIISSELVPRPVATPIWAIMIILNIIGYFMYALLAFQTLNLATLTWLSSLSVRTSFEAYFIIILNWMSCTILSSGIPNTFNTLIFAIALILLGSITTALIDAGSNTGNAIAYWSLALTLIVAIIISVRFVYIVYYLDYSLDATEKKRSITITVGTYAYPSYQTKQESRSYLIAMLCVLSLCIAQIILLFTSFSHQTSIGLTFRLLLSLGGSCIFPLTVILSPILNKGSKD